MPLPWAIENIKKQPTALVIAGATGNLARKRIFPALVKLWVVNLLPQQLQIIACARTPHTDEDFRQIVKEIIEAKNIKLNKPWKDFASKISYISADFAQNKNLEEVAKKLDVFEDKLGGCPKRIYYLAILPDIFEKAILNLGKHNFHLACPKHKKLTSKPVVIVEKPFGRDLASAQKIAKTLTQFFGEDQIYRIDHYLGKETVQNIFTFRFANEIFEPIWNSQYIDHVQITTAEAIGVEKRGEFYDKTGALRDILQNHLLQLLTLTAMEEPEGFQVNAIRKKKLEVLKSVKVPSENEIVTSTVRGQYEGYLREEKIAPNSQTETYALTKLLIQNQRWQGVPFYLRCGKKLMGKVTSIIIQFKEKGPIPNHITIQIQPNEGIGIRLAAKKPGLTTVFEPVDMEFCYKTSFDIPQPDAYERLLLDIILGDQSLFISQEEVEASWKIIDPIEEVWRSGKPKLAIYKPGSWGPKEAENLIKKDGRVWLAPILTICKI